MDRFLASTPVAADCFQLLGVTALLLASKQVLDEQNNVQCFWIVFNITYSLFCVTQVEVCSPRISHLLSLCCDAFTKEQLCNLECFILLRLNFRLAAPTLSFFLDYYTKCIEAAKLVPGNTGDNMPARVKPDTKRPGQCSTLARKVCELSLADYAFNKYPPSLTASCALRLASELQKTEQVLVEPTTHASIQSQDDQWDSFMDELCESSHSLADSDPQLSEGCSLAVESYDTNLAQECKDNLKMLVSLNQEALEVMSNM